MKKIVAIVILALTMASTFGRGATSIPTEFHGDWETKVMTDEGFPWWSQAKYPVRLKISDDGVTFEDQSGMVCRFTLAFYDAEIDALVIRHCGETKSPNAFPPYYMVRLIEEGLCGEVWTYKEILSFVARRVDMTD